MPNIIHSRPKPPKQTKTRLPDHQGRKFHSKQYNTAGWRKLRLIVLANDPICVECGREYANEVDHINPIRLGGSFHDVNNLQALCKSCHAKKSARERYL